ncbi:MAG TPA: hypothetical protein VF516_12710, partial [Kofleriaceae bacterium]
LALIVVCATASADTRDRRLTVVEATIPELQAALRSGRIADAPVAASSRRLMLELGDLTLGAIVTTAGLADRAVCGRCRVTLEEVGGRAPAALPAGA